ncbi:MAG: hypothetical protein ACRDKL_07455 [Solirubrobacteraceae bacterium]
MASSTGAIMVVVLLVAGGLLTWGHGYVNTTVHNQLATQQIYFPQRAAWTQASKNNTGEIQLRMIPYLERYSGLQLLSGPQAEAYADHFIAYHLAAMPYGGVYSKISNALLTAKPGSTQATQLSALKAVSFQGTTLRGLLLEAYGFWKVGEVMMWGAIAAFILAAAMAALVGGGLWHAARAAEEARVFDSHHHELVLPSS